MDFCNKNALYAKQKADQAYSQQFEIQRDRLQICSYILYRINLPPVFLTERTYSSVIRPFLLFKFLKPLCWEQVEEPFNVTSAAAHLQLWTNVQTVIKQASRCCSSQKLAILIRTIICGSKMTVTTSLNNESHVTHMLVCTCAYKFACPLPIHAGLVEADGWVKPSLPGQIKMSPRAMLSAEPPICSSATELRWMPL